MRKVWKVGIGIGVVFVTLIAFLVNAVAGKMDRRNEALNAMQNFFEVAKGNELNQYLDYCKLEQLFYEKDVKVQGSFYTDIAKLTIQTDLEGIIDKAANKVQVLGDVGLGGMPFAEFDAYSDECNLYVDSEIFQDKMLKLDYTQDLYKQGEAYGISRRYVTMLQKGYITLFQMAVSQSKYEKIERIMEDDCLKEDLLQIYDVMQVERQENEDELVGGYVYQINIPAKEVTHFLNDMANVYPKFDKDGYKNLVGKLVSSKNGVNITLFVDKNGDTISVSAANEESGYEVVLKRNELEKENSLGFESQFGVMVSKNEIGILNLEMVFDYDMTDSSFELKAKEDVTGMNVSAKGNVKTDIKKERIVIDIAEMKMAYGNHDVDLKANFVITFGDYEIEIPNKKKVDVINGTLEELCEVQNLFWQEMECIAGDEIRQFLSSVGVNY